MKNRATAQRHYIAPPEPVCPECGVRERHWVGEPMSIENIVLGTMPMGFWTCAKFYGPDGRRIEP
jgi:hypothetical protein